MPTQPRVALAGEGCGEPWLPYLDLMLSLEISRERYAAPDGWETIPFFNAVYHDCVVTFGNYSSLTMPPYDDLWPAEFAPKEPLKLLDRKFSRQFYLEQARAFVWGQQPTVANFLPAHLQERPEEIDYATRLARIRGRAKDYLLHGTFLRPPKLDVPEAVLDLSRLSIYAGQQGGLRTFQKRAPLALAGAWRAPNGTVAVALAGIADEPCPLSFRLDAREYGLPKRGRIHRLDEKGGEEIGKFNGAQASVELTLPPRGACVLEFRAATNLPAQKAHGGRSTETASGQFTVRKSQKRERLASSFLRQAYLSGQLCDGKSMDDARENQFRRQLCEWQNRFHCCRLSLSFSLRAPAAAGSSTGVSTIHEVQNTFG